MASCLLIELAFYFVLNATCNAFNLGLGSICGFFGKWLLWVRGLFHLSFNNTVW